MYPEVIRAKLTVTLPGFLSDNALFGVLFATDFCQKSKKLSVGGHSQSTGCKISGGGRGGWGGTLNTQFGRSPLYFSCSYFFKRGQVLRDHFIYLKLVDHLHAIYHKKSSADQDITFSSPFLCGM